MSAIAFLKTAVGHLQRTEIADVDAVRAGQAAIAAAQSLEGRAIDDDFGAGIVGAQYALFGVAEHRVIDIEIATLDPDAGTVAIRNALVLKDDAVDGCRLAPQDQRSLALADAAIEDRLARYGSLVGDPPG